MYSQFKYHTIIDYQHLFIYTILYIYIVIYTAILQLNYCLSEQEKKIIRTIICRTFRLFYRIHTHDYKTITELQYILNSHHKILTLNYLTYYIRLYSPTFSRT